MPCTTLLVGKNASYDGSTMMARNEDSGSGSFTAKKFIVVNPNEQAKEYKSVISKIKITLPDNPLRYTAMPNAISDEGIWTKLLNLNKRINKLSIGILSLVLIKTFNSFSIFPSILVLEAFK